MNTLERIGKEKLIKLNHYMVGLGLIIKGIEKAGHYSHFPLSVIFFFTAGGIIIIGTLFHHQVEKIYKKFDALFFILEAVALMLAAVIMFEKAGSKIPYFLIFISVLYFTIGLAFIFTNESNQEAVFTILQKIIRIVFLVSAAVIIIINIIFFNSIWLYIMALLFASIGFFVNIFNRMAQKYSK